jgi:hypothetical protein
MTIEFGSPVAHIREETTPCSSDVAWLASDTDKPTTSPLSSTPIMRMLPKTLANAEDVAAMIFPDGGSADAQAALKHILGTSTVGGIVADYNALRVVVAGVGASTRLRLSACRSRSRGRRFGRGRSCLG